MMWRLRRLRRRAYNRIWPITETCRSVTLDGEPYQGKFTVEMRLNGPTTIDPPLAGRFEITTISTRRLFGRWRPREIGRLDLLLIDGMDPTSKLLSVTLTTVV